MKAMAAFYATLGVNVTGGAPEWENRGWPGGPGVVLGFRLGSRSEVDDTYARLTAAGQRGQQPPYDAFWGARYAVVTDPDGNAVGLMSPSDPAMRTRAAPPAEAASA